MSENSAKRDPSHITIVYIGGLCYDTNNLHADEKEGTIIGLD